MNAPKGARPARERGWTGTLMVLGLLLALFSFFSVSWWTLVAPVVLLRWFLVLCFIGPAIALAWPRARFGMQKLEWLFFNLLAVGPWVMCSVLWLNYGVRGPVERSEHLIARIENTRVRQNSRGELVRSSSDVIHFELADGYLKEYPWALSTWHEFVQGHGDSLRVGVATGLLGMDVVVSKELH